MTDRDHKIDLIRSIAVLSVLSFHLDFFHYGFLGVDLFFCISGYLLIPQLFDLGASTRSGFMTRRILRIWPSAVFTVLIILLCSVFFLPAGLRYDFYQSAIAFVFRLQNVLFYFESDYFATDSDFKLLLHYWSLAVEEQVFFLLYLISFVRFCRTNHLHILVFLFGLSCSLAFILDESASFFLPFTRLWEFVFGYIALVRFKLSVVLLSVLFCVASLCSAGNVLLICVTFLFFLILTRRSELPPLVGSCSRFVADRSYSLYLVHWPVIVFSGLFFHPADPFVSVLMIVVIGILAEIVFQIDVVFRRWKN